MRIIETSFWAHAASRTSYSVTTAGGYLVRGGIGNFAAWHQVGGSDTSYTVKT